MGGVVSFHDGHHPYGEWSVAVLLHNVPVYGWNLLTKGRYYWGRYAYVFDSGPVSSFWALCHVSLGDVVVAKAVYPA